MKTGEVSKAMGVSPKTILNWTTEEALAGYFSTGAKGADGNQRDYSNEDILVLNTIRLRKTRNNTWKDIAVMLETGHRETELPVSAALLQTLSPVEHMGQLMILKGERDLALAQLQDALTENDELRGELKETRENAKIEVKEVRADADERIQQINDVATKELNALNKQIGRLEAQLELAQQRIQELEKGNDNK